MTFAGLARSLMALALAGCGTIKPIGLGDLPIGAAPAIPASIVSIVDLTKSNQDAPAGWGAGFHHIADQTFDRPPGAVLAADLRRLLKPSGSGLALDVWVTDAGFFWEKTGADFVPIVNLFTFQKSGRLKCEATIALRRGESTSKATIEHFVASIDTNNLRDEDMIWTNAVRECYPALRAKVLAAIQAFR